MVPILAWLALTGSIFFPCSFLICTFLLRKWVGIQSTAVQTAVAMRLTSVLQAFMASVCGWYIVTHCYHDFLYARCWLVDTYMSFGLPYMLYDIGAMYASYHRDAEAKQNAIISKKLTFVPFLNRQKLIITHHLLVAFVGYPIALFYRNGKGDFFLGCILLTELSSPFVNLRAILKKFNRTGSNLYRINNALILLIFFLCRILIFPITFWVYSWDKQVYWFQVPWMIPWHCTLGCTIIGGFQLMWYVMFAKAMWKMHEKGAKVDRNKNLANGAVGEKSA
ncbi:hypothetical protein BSL78_24814 [Apostichopus japonicus]|uniref:TLC domain-containing protein n=1 Tax=Stichopus japonicus TaxID=307972 RepID=A0A2G8JRK6_STIJA|nr:hypothetical protein BSL78_24814 [Apostichopus japonicus]